MDDIAAFLGSHPEIAAAVSYGLRNLTVTRPDDPVAFLAEQLRAFNAKNKYESCVVKLAVAPPAAQQQCIGQCGMAVFSMPFCLRHVHELQGAYNSKACGCIAVTKVTKPSQLSPCRRRADGTAVLRVLVSYLACSSFVRGWDASVQCQEHV